MKCSAKGAQVHPVTRTGTPSGSCPGQAERFPGARKSRRACGPRPWLTWGTPSRLRTKSWWQNLRFLTDLRAATRTTAQAALNYARTTGVRG